MTHVGDEYYAIAVKAYDSEEAAPAIEAGIAGLNAAAQGKGFADYLSVGWERDRVDILRGIEDSAFFQTVRGGLVTGLYNQKAVWPLFRVRGRVLFRGRVPVPRLRRHYLALSHSRRRRKDYGCTF